LELPQSIPNDHRDFINHALDALTGDGRIVGIAAGGSFRSDQMDDHSDIDLVIVVSEKSLTTDTEARMEIASRLGPLLTGFVGNHVGDPRLLICLYSPPLVKVDLKFIVADDLSRRVEDPVILYDPSELIAKALRETEAKYPMPNRQWIEDAFWIWIQAGSAKIRRGELFEARGILNFLLEKVIGPLTLIESGHQPAGVRRIEFLAPDQAAALGALCAPYDRGAIKEAYRQAAILYVSLRRDAGYRTEAEQVAMLYLFET
jgi:hypothetical protein